MYKKDSIYVVLCVIFSVFIVLGNLIFQKFVVLNISSLFSFELSVGTILFPITFLLTDLIAEFYGKEKATFCVRLAILMNVMVALIILGMDALDATSWSKVNNVIFHNVFGVYSIAFIGSMIACYISQAIDIKIFLWIRKVTKGEWLWARNMGSTTVSLFIDTLIVNCFLTVFQIIPNEKTFLLVMNSYMFKFFFSVFSIPLFYLAVRMIKSLQNPENVMRM